MRITTRGRGVEVTEDLRERADRRVGFALDRFASDVAAVDVLLHDENGPRGGVDKHCQVTVRGTRGWQVRASVEATDAVVAIDDAVDRAGRAVARTIERRSQLRDRASAAEVADRTTPDRGRRAMKGR